MSPHSAPPSHRRARFVLWCLAILALSAALACDHASPTDPDTRAPLWLQSMISRIRSEPVTNPPTAIYGYRYRGEPVYFRTARCCDFPSELYDRAGALLCTPDGGLVGGVDPRCADFFTTRRDERLIWRDPRN